MSRDNDIVTFQTQNPVTSTAGTVTQYFTAGSRPMLARHHYMMGINPSDTDGDTVSSTWDYTIDGGANYVTISDETAFEYNDTTDTNALGDLGDNTAAVVAVGTDLNVRVPAGAVIRHREITAGTITGIQLNCVLEFIVL